MTFFGKIEPYDPEIHNFQDYSEWMEQFFTVNYVKEDMKVPLFLTAIGSATYGVLKALLSPELPQDLSYEELIETLTRYYVVKKSIVVARYEFYNCTQKENQNVKDFVVEIKRKAALCNFGTSLNEALRDRLLCGLIGDELVQVLLAVGDSLSFDEAVKIAAAHESADKETKKIKHDVSVKFLQGQHSCSKSLDSPSYLINQ